MKRGEAWQTRTEKKEEATAKAQNGPVQGASSCAIASFPLALADEGETVRIIMIRSGARLEQRLLDMGLRINDAVTMISKRPGGAMIIEKSGSRFALGGGMALKINVIRE